MSMAQLFKNFPTLLNDNVAPPAHGLFYRPRKPKFVRFFGQSGGDDIDGWSHWVVFTREVTDLIKCIQDAETDETVDSGGSADDAVASLARSLGIDVSGFETYAGGPFRHSASWGFRHGHLILRQSGGYDC